MSNHRGLLLLIFAALTQLICASMRSYDIVVYDASSAGVIAAVAAARHLQKTYGSAKGRVALLCASWPSCWDEGGRRVGGLSSGGLGQTDIGNYNVIGGFALEFYERNRRKYTPNITEKGYYAPLDNQWAQSCRLPQSECNMTWNLEPHIALEIFEEMLAEAQVDVFYEAQLSSLKISTTPHLHIDSLITTEGDIFNGRVFIEGSYEGDLVAMANITVTTGREAKDQYNESLAGRTAGASSNQFDLAIDPYDASGALLPLIQPWDGVTTEGVADKKITAYNFRLCVTTNRSNLVSFAKPTTYNSSTWELLRRYIVACTNKRATTGRGCQLGFPSCNTQPVPNSKFDMNNCGGISSDFIGGSWAYPTATPAARRSIWTQHRDYVQGLLWTMANDPAIPASVRQDMAKWGLCADEFPATDHFPPALYVREARRMIGDKVFTQNTPSQLRNTGDIGNLSIGLGSYNFDSHNTQRFACTSKQACMGSGPSSASGPYVWDEGDVQVNPGSYQIPAWVLLPPATQAANLLAPGTPSASHIGMSSLRMEPQFMILGHAAGVTAALAVEAVSSSAAFTPVRAVPQAAVHAALLVDGAKLSLEPPALRYGCLGPPEQRRCVPISRVDAPTNVTCEGKCQPLAEGEWLANDSVFKITTDPGGRAYVTALKNTYLKKTEIMANTFPSSSKLILAVKQGQQLDLVKPATKFDEFYKLVVPKLDRFVY